MPPMEPSPGASLTSTIIRALLGGLKKEGAIEHKAETASSGSCPLLADALAAEESVDDESPYAGFGVMSAQGGAKHMEDSYSVREKLSSPELSRPSVIEEGGPVQQQAPLSHEDEVSIAGFSEDLAFFSVFDGHGGDEVAQHCSDRLHQHFTRLLVSGIPSPSSSDHHAPPLASTASDPGPPQPTQSLSTPPPAALPPLPRHNHSNLNPGTTATPFAAASPRHKRSASACCPMLVTDALRSSFLHTDNELAGTDNGEYVGATAVVAVVGKQHLWVAHCGDSRAVIQRGGDAEALTQDHKPDREDEAARIKAAGGRIVFNGGTRRVNGMLAMTRSIGDHYLRPYVIAEPEVVCIERTLADELLILATDGLWDVFGITEATALASRCIARSRERSMSKHAACRVAASVLANTALERGSRDNITVIVVDVSLPAGGEGGEGSSAGEELVASSAQQEGLRGASSTAAPAGAPAGDAGNAGPAAGAGPGLSRSSAAIGRYLLLRSQSRGEVAVGSGRLGGASSGGQGERSSPRGGSERGLLDGEASSNDIAGSAGHGGVVSPSGGGRMVCSHGDLQRLCSDEAGAAAAVARAVAAGAPPRRWFHAHGSASMGPRGGPAAAALGAAAAAAAPLGSQLPSVPPSEHSDSALSSAGGGSTPVLCPGSPGCSIGSPPPAALTSHLSGSPSRFKSLAAGLPLHAPLGKGVAAAAAAPEVATSVGRGVRELAWGEEAAGTPGTPGGLVMALVAPALLQPDAPTGLAAGLLAPVPEQEVQGKVEPARSRGAAEGKEEAAVEVWVAEAGPTPLQPRLLGAAGGVKSPSGMLAGCLAAERAAAASGGDSEGLMDGCGSGDVSLPNPHVTSLHAVSLGATQIEAGHAAGGRRTGGGGAEAGGGAAGSGTLPDELSPTERTLSCP